MSAQVVIPQITQQDIDALAANPVAPADELRFANPTKEMQEAFVGHSFKHTYFEASIFLNYMLQYAAAEKTPERILDVGCGWGRMLRLLRHAPVLAKTELYGCDIDDDALDVDRRTIPGVWFTKIGTYPPTVYRDGLFDAIYAYSVLSHLSEKNHMAWAAEFARLIRPGGFACVTTQGPNFFEMCREYREGIKPITHNWHNEIARCFADPNDIERYRAGEFMYVPRHQKHADPDYGQTAVPRQYFEKHWGELGFKVVNWDESQQQARIVMQRV
jgi:2-polyprenyl-3-methyl-5-hydroxy-6-metoxy-1,4-benzoquinol methylase